MTKQKTTILIRPAARGGKYLGHDAANAQNHSALIALLQPATGKIITHAFAKAPTAQSAGPLQLMGCTKRSDPFAADSDTVHVRLSVEIEEPTVFRVVVYGPLSHPDQARMAQADITVLPGVDIGLSPQYPEGLVVEVPGLCISNVTSNLQGAQINCTAKVAMMCGCQIHQAAADPYWPWPDTDFSVQLVTLMRSKAVFYYPLAYDATPGSVSSFTGQWPSQAAPGDTVEQAWVYASEPKLGNQGEYKIFSSQTVPSPLPPELQRLLAAAGHENA
jgi:hypothetical protein